MLSYEQAEAPNEYRSSKSFKFDSSPEAAGPGKIFHSHKFGLVYLAANINNVVPTPLFIFFQLIDKGFLVAMLLLITVSQNLGISVKANRMGSLFWDQTYFPMVLLILSGVILVVHVTSVLCFYIIASKIKDVEDCHTKSNLPKILSLVQAIIEGALPSFTIFVAAFTFTSISRNQNDMRLWTLLALNIIILCLQIWSVLYSNKIYNLALPTAIVPYTRMDESLTKLVNYLMMILLSVNQVIHEYYEDEIEQHKTIVYIVVLLMSALHSIVTIIMPTYFNKKLEYGNILSAAFIFTLALIQIFNHLTKDQISSIYIVYYVILFIFLTPFHFVMSRIWRDKLFSNLLTKDLSQKLLIKYSIATAIETMEYLDDLPLDKMLLQLSTAFSHIDFHRQSCENELCMCHHVDSVYWMIIQAQNQNATNVELDEEELNFLNTFTEAPLVEEDDGQQASPFILEQSQRKKLTAMNQQQDSTTHKKSTQSKVKFNIQKLVLAFVSNYIKDFIFQAQAKYPDDEQIHFFSAYFTLYQSHNIYRSLAIIKSFNLKNKSFAEKANIFMVHMLLIGKCQDLIKNQASFEDGFHEAAMGVITEQYMGQQRKEQHFNPETFIALNKLHLQFSDCVLSLCCLIHEFWQFQVQEEYIMHKVISVSKRIADYICYTFDLFQVIDDQSKQKDFKLYFQFASIQKQLLNDKDAYELYNAKAKSVINLSRVSYQNNLLLFNTDRDCGMIIASAMEDSIGSIIMCNNFLMQGLGFALEDLKYRTIDSLMPMQVRQYHQAFLKNNSYERTTTFLNHKLSVFVKKKSGYVVPVELVLKYHYSQDMGHIYIGKISFLHEIHAGTPVQSLQTDALMFFLCDGETGRVFDLTENCVSVLGLTHELVSENQFCPTNSQLTIFDIVPINDAMLLNSDSLSFEAQVEMNMECISNFYSQARFENQPNIAHTSCYVFKENLFKKQLKMNIVAVQIPEPNLIVYKQKKSVVKQQKGKTTEEAMYQDFFIQISQEIDSFSQTQSSQFSLSADESSNIQNILRNNTFSMRKKIPRVQRIVVQLILLVFFIMCVVSSINLYLSKQIHANLQMQINTVYQSFERITLTSKARVAYRIQMNIANGIISDYSNFLQASRYEVYQNVLMNTTDALAANQYYFDNEAIKWTEPFQEEVNKKIKVILMNQDGTLTNEYYSMAIAMNMYISRLQDVIAMNQTQMNGQLNILSIDRTPPGYIPTYNERILAFVDYNGMDQIRVAALDQTDLYMNQTKARISSNRLRSILTACISIVSIVIVGLSLLPLIKQIVQRQCQALSFFLQLPKETIQDQMNLCAEYRKVLENVQEEVEEVKPKDRSPRKRNQRQHTDEGGIQSFVKQDENFNRDSMNDKSLIFNGASLDLSKQEMLISHNIHHSNDEHSLDSDFHDGYAPNVAPNEQVYDAQQSFQTLVNNQQTFVTEMNRPPMEQKKKEKREKRTKRKDNKKVKDGEEDDEAENAELDLVTKKHKIINSTKSKLLQSTMFRISLLMLVSSVYFIGSFFLSNVTYNSIPLILDSLQLLYFRDACTQMLISDVREAIILNNTIMIQMGKQNVDIIQYVSEQCLQLQVQYDNFRKDLPPALDPMGTQILEIETDKLCSYVYPDDPSKISDCLGFTNGLLTKGLSAMTSYTINQFKRINDNFFSSMRSQDDIIYYAKYPLSAQLVDINILILDDFFTRFKTEATQLSSAFFLKNSNQYLYLYVGFIIILVLLLAYFRMRHYSKIKDYLWKTNLLLKLLPADKLPNDKCQEVKQFLSSQ